MFAAIPLIWRVVGLATAVVALLGGIGIWIHSVDAAGYRRAELEWTIKYDRREIELQRQRFNEIDRQAFANDEAKKAELEEIDDLEDQLLVMSEIAERLAEEAAADPDKDRIAFDAEAVARHNRRIGH